MKSSVNKYINNQISDLKKEMLKNKKMFFTLSGFLMVINIVMVTIAGIIIKDLSKIHSGTRVGLILASFAAVAVILIFTLQIGIIFYRSLMKETTYKNARDKIQVEVFKFNAKKAEYKNKNAEELLTKKVIEIKATAIKHKRHKSVSSIILKGFTGGEDD